MQADGSLLQTGGGDVTVKIAGALNALPDAQILDAISTTLSSPTAGGVFADLRGDLSIAAGSIGGLVGAVQSPRGRIPGVRRRPARPGRRDPSRSPPAARWPSPAMPTPGSRRSRTPPPTASPPRADRCSATTRAASPTSPCGPTPPRVDLLSIGADIDPIAAGGGQSDGHAYAPGVLSIMAPVGNVVGQNTLLELAPSTAGGLTLLAGQSIYNLSIDVSGANPDIMATPLHRPSACSVARMRTTTVPTATASSVQPTTPFWPSGRIRRPTRSGPTWPRRSMQ